MSLRDKIENLVEKLATRAADEKTPIEAATDALKAISAYYAVQVRENRHRPDEAEDEGFTFDKGIEKLEQANGRIQGRARRRGADS